MLIEQKVPVTDENNKLNWRQVASDFAHNALFSFAVGPFINGMSSAINNNGFWKGVKEVATTWRGWRCNAELAVAVGVIATTVNILMGKNRTKPEPRHESAAILKTPWPMDGAAISATHSVREDARREQAVDARINR